MHVRAHYKTGMCLRYLAAREIEIPAHTIIAQLQAANAVPHMLAPDAGEVAEPSQKGDQSQVAQASTPLDEKTSSCVHLRPEDTGCNKVMTDYSVLDQIDLFGCATWTKEEQGATRKLLEDYVDLFSKNDLDLS